MEGSRLIATEKIIAVSSPGCENQVEKIRQWGLERGIDFLAIEIILQKHPPLHLCIFPNHYHYAPRMV